MQTCTQNHVYFNDLSDHTHFVTWPFYRRAQLIFAKARLKKIHQQSYFFTANHLKNSVDVAWL